MAHILGIPKITVEDHEKYADIKAWAKAQDQTDEQFIKDYALWVQTGQIDSQEIYEQEKKQRKEEYEIKLASRKAFRHGLYGKERYGRFIVEECKKNDKDR